MPHRRAAGTGARGGQLELPIPPGWGGRRPGAGRKPRPGRQPTPHRARPFHDRQHPVHVTLRARREVGSLRRARVFPAVREAITAASRARFRVVHFSVQGDHLHLLVEGDSHQALVRGVRGLVIRLALAVNRALGRRGRVWADRYHSRDLTTPREVRHTLVYVINNFKKHVRGPDSRGIDLCSSGPWFTGWRERPALGVKDVVQPVAPPRTWLLNVGWRCHGLIPVNERPRGE